MSRAEANPLSYAQKAGGQTGDAAIEALAKEISEHQKHDSNRSLIDQAFGHLYKRDKESLAQLKQLEEKIGERQKAGDGAGVKQLTAGIAEKIKDNRAAVQMRDEIHHYGAGLAKTALLFTRASGVRGAAVYGLAGVVGMLDEVKSERDGKAIDAALGFAKGVGTKASLDLIVGGAHKLSLAQSAQPAVRLLSVPLQGLAMGVSNSAIEQTLTRDSWLDECGWFKASNVLTRLKETTFAPATLAADALVFSAGMGALGLVGKAARGALAASLTAASMAVGFSFGSTAGAIAEVSRQKLEDENINPLKVAARSLLQGGLDGVAALAGHRVSVGLKPGVRKVERLSAGKPEESAASVSEVAEKPVLVENPEKLPTGREFGEKKDWIPIYEELFPIEERQNTQAVEALISKGRVALHVTRSAEGKPLAFSLTSIHDEQPMKFAHLDYIGVDQSLQSKQIGSTHFKRLIDWIKRDHPDYTAVTLEMERRGAGEDAESNARREARARFYTRLGAKQATEVDYNILNHGDLADRIPAEWWYVELKPGQYKTRDAVLAYYVNEGGYGREPGDPAVEELRVQFEQKGK